VRVAGFFFDEGFASGYLFTFLDIREGFHNLIHFSSPPPAWDDRGETIAPPEHVLAGLDSYSHKPPVARRPF